MDVEMKDALINWCSATRPLDECRFLVGKLASHRIQFLTVSEVSILHGDDAGRTLPAESASEGLPERVSDEPMSQYPERRVRAQLPAPRPQTVSPPREAAGR